VSTFADELSLESPCEVVGRFAMAVAALRLLLWLVVTVRAMLVVSLRKHVCLAGHHGVAFHASNPFRRMLGMEKARCAASHVLGDFVKTYGLR